MAVRGALSIVFVMAFGLAVAPMAAQAQQAPEPLRYEMLPAVTTDALSIQVASDGRVIWTQRDGTIWVLTPEGAQIRAGQLAVSANMCPTCLGQDEGETFWHGGFGDPDTGMAGLEEGGLHSIMLARDFDETGRIYLYRSMPGTRNPGPGFTSTVDGHPVPPTFGVFRLSTYVLNDLNVLDPLSEEVILEVPAEWDNCCHYGGQLNYLPDGTILLSTGDDVDFHASNGYGPRDHRYIWFDGERSSANPADRRGKILRFMPDGSVPDGSQPGIEPNPFIGHEGWNPYIADTSGTPDDGWIAFDPYVYALGFKQPWRGVVHEASGTLFIDDVGPDATVDDPERGPRGFEEINAVELGGGTHFGWPRCMADNQPYVDVNWETMEVGGLLDCSPTAPVSRPLPGAPDQTTRSGMTGAAFFYGRDIDPVYPAIGSGGLTAEPVIIYPEDQQGPLRLPEHYNNRLITLEYSRSLIYSIPVNDDGSLELDGSAVERMNLTPTHLAVGANDLGETPLPSTLLNPIDAAVGPDGAIYVVEYGPTLYGHPSRLSRISCADCSPADPSRNYGIPVAAAAEADGGSPAIGGLAFVAGFAALLPVAAIGARRRKATIV